MTHEHGKMPPLLEHAWHEFEHEQTPERAAWFLIMMVFHKENIYWDDKEKRIKCAAEVYDSSWKDKMEKVTEVLGIKTWEEFVKVKNKYNLTQY
ncbi:MAG: hypothetical protein DRN25_00785 [Thermoplasmata archaeon]|nr:MAG: hypothetical protein DRN25_00785 [Thermoplasmata archaeon]